MQQDQSAHLPRTIQLSPAHGRLIASLFSSREGSSGQLQRSGIVDNPEGLFELLESSALVELRQVEPSAYYETKTEIWEWVSKLMGGFALNAKFLYEEGWRGEKKRSLVHYLLRDMQDGYQWQLQQQEKEGRILDKLQEVICSIFEQICVQCTLRTSELKQITNSLTDCYFRSELTCKIIEQCFRLLEVGLQQRTITPYLYFLGNSSDSLKVLLLSNHWPFAGGMTMMLWIHPLRVVDCTLLWLKTEDGSELIVRVRDGAVEVEAGKEKVRIGTISSTVSCLGVQLQPCEGFFKSSNYTLNISLHNVLYTNVTSQPLKFSNSDFITEFSMLNNFIGNCYSLIITTRPQLNQLQEISKLSIFGVSRQTQVWELIERKLLKTDSILCIFNSERNFQGLILNYVSERNHACFEGKISEVAYHKYDAKLIEIYLPFLYFLTLLPSEKRDESWNRLFTMITQHILQLSDREQYQTDSLLFLLLFFEYAEYRITQSTLEYLLHLRHNHYLDLVAHFLDPHAILARGLTLPNMQGFNQDPVERTVFLFHLQSRWAEKWNLLQGFDGWWSPSFFSSQNNKPFDPSAFVYDPKRENKVEWSVMNLVTKDYCKCLVEPVFAVPKYAQMNRFQEEYVRKQCFQENFTVNLHKITQNQLLICRKTAQSSFQKLKTKFLGNNKEIASTPHKKTQSTELKQFQTQCLYIDTLTVVQGTVRTTKEGLIIFSSRHHSKSFDHMCIKANKNEVFYYISIPTSQIRTVFKKRFNATHNAVYIKTKAGRQIMLHFYLLNADIFLNLLEGHVKIKRDSYNNYLKSHQPFLWIEKSISNYEYLQWLNEIAGRNYNDITQYPVLPWVYVADQEEENKPEGDRNNWRDLTKNMGRQGDEDRIRHFMQKFHSDNQEELFSEYHFGTHYSSSAIIFNFLIRIRPFSIGAITLQSGKFDCADRIFYSYCGSWNNAITSTTDLRELIPEIYTLPEMFINKNNYDYGKTQQKIVVDNVILPAWAGSNPYKFVATIRRKLEHQRVSQTINNWIDLIYGYKQRGKDAIEHMNIFYPLTYENSIDLNKVKDEEERNSFQTMIAHFGQNPAQIIGNNPHPCRRTSIKAQWEDKLIADGGDFLIRKTFLSKASMKEQKFLFKSIFQGRNSILSIKFLNHDHFFVLRKHEYYLFKILNKKQEFLSKQEEISYELQSCAISLNYKELASCVPVTAINDDIVIVGGFYNGHAQIIFIRQARYNRSFKFPTSTITALNFQKKYHSLFIGDASGYLRVYRVTITPKQLQFQDYQFLKAHDSKINQITFSEKGNLLCSCSEDGTLNLYNLYSIQILRTIRQPNGCPINFAHITTSPLYAVCFYSRSVGMVHVYSINGQFLDALCDRTGQIYSLNVQKASDSTQCLVYLNAQRELFVWQLPFLKEKKKMRVKKDDYRVSCFEMGSGKIGLAGTEDGAMQIITHHLCY